MKEWNNKDTEKNEKKGETRNEGMEEKAKR